MKRTPIIVTVPGQDGNELWLTLTEAKQLRNKLDRKIALIQAKRNKKATAMIKKITDETLFKRKKENNKR